MPLATINGQVFFIHVPKCGGASAGGFLARHGARAPNGPKRRREKRRVRGLRFRSDFALRRVPCSPPYAALTRRHHALD